MATIVPLVTQAEDNPGGTPRSEFKKLRQAVLDDRAAVLRREFLPAFFGRGTTAGEAVSDELIAWAGDLALGSSLRATAAGVDAIMDSDFRPDLPAFDIPVLLLHGDADVNVPIVTSRAAAAAIPGARLVVYDGQPHALMFTQRERLTRDMLDFIQEAGR